MSYRYAVNCSILFTELPLHARPTAAREAGFEAIELWWPFDSPEPDQRDIDALVTTITDAGVQLAGLNFFAGDMPGGERGVLSHPGRVEEFHRNVSVVAEIGERLGCRTFNALYGNRIANVDPHEQDAVARENLGYAARAIATVGGTVLVEPVSGSPGYPLRTADDVLNVITRTQAEQSVTNLGFLCDLYHLAVNGDDLDQVIDEHSAKIAHVQVADVPGRHEPGTGNLELGRHLAHLTRRGYEGWIALEYAPSSATTESFDWLTQSV